MTTGGHHREAAGPASAPVRRLEGRASGRGGRLREPAPFAPFVHPAGDRAAHEPTGKIDEPTGPFRIDLGRRGLPGRFSSDGSTHLGRVRPPATCSPKPSRRGSGPRLQADEPAESMVGPRPGRPGRLADDYACREDGRRTASGRRHGRSRGRRSCRTSLTRPPPRAPASSRRRARPAAWSSSPFALRVVERKPPAPPRPLDPIATGTLGSLLQLGNRYGSLGRV